MALTAQEIAAARDKLDFVKEKIAGRRKFSSEVREELDALEKGLAERGFDPEFSAEILREIAEAIFRCDGNHQLRLRCARSMIKEVRSGDQMEMLSLVEKIGVHFAMMTLLELMNNARTLEERVGYGNLCSKFARTSISQTELLQRLRLGPDPKLMVNIGQGGQAAIVGHLTQNAAENVQPRTISSPPLVTDQSGMAMPVVEQDAKAAATVSPIEHDQKPATRRKRRK